MAKEKDDQLDCTTSRYEERLVELHSVIAELSRQLEEKNREQINEEETDDEEEEEDDTEKHEAVESRTSTEVNDRALEVRLRKSRHANIRSKNQFFRENVVVIAFSELRPGSNERYENSTFYGPFRFLIFILIFNKKNIFCKSV